jgi:hypothetical protein
MLLDRIFLVKNRPHRPGKKDDDQGYSKKSKFETKMQKRSKTLDSYELEEKKRQTGSATKTQDGAI